MKAKKTGRKKALVVTSRNVHYPLIQPVIEELRRRNWKVMILRFEGIWERIETIFAKKRSITSFYVKPSSQPTEQMPPRRSDIISKLIFHFIKTFRVRRPDIIIIMTESSSPCRIAVLVGKLAKIPSLLFLHSGLIGRTYDCPTLLADKISVIGESARKALIKCGIDENRLVVTGRASYDALVHAEKEFDKNQICSKFGLNPKKKICVYTTDNLPQRDIEATVYAICKAVKNFPELQFIIKLHPSELSASMYKRVTKNVGIDSLITRNANIYEVLYVCDVMITGYSATALDAMVLNKPVITVNFTGLEDPVPFAESGAAIGVYKENDLMRAIENGLYDEEVREKLREAREKFVYEYAYKRDGKSTERVIKLLEHMTKGWDKR